MAQEFIPKVLSVKDQSALIDQWLAERVKTVLPEIMRREGIDMWVIVSREYNEDPVIKTLLPSTWMAARRRTILVVYDPGAGKDLELMAIARYDVGEAFKRAWNPDQQPDQWKALSELVASKKPKKIAVNTSDNYGHADGINATELTLLKANLRPADAQKIVSAEKVAVGWLETRTPSEMVVYQQIVAIAHQIIAEGFSEKVVQPGVTTTEDIVWWYRQRIADLGLTAWFHPTVDIQRADPESFDHLRSFSKRPDTQTVQPGDLLHVDFGITYLRLNTDTQQLAYVLKPTETAPPAYLVEALKEGNRLQDILTSQFRTGRSGNEILRAARAQAGQEGIKATIYTHPIGYHGHAAGPTIGMWDNQGDTPGSGDYPLYPNTCYSIELNAAVYIEAWDKEIRVMLEEDAFFDGESVRYINGRQTKLLTIPRLQPHLGN